MAERKPERKSKRKSKAKPKPRTTKQRAKAAQSVLAEVREGKGPAGGDRYQQTERDIEIWRARMRGLQPESLAAAYNMEVRTIREIIQRVGREAARIRDQDPAEIIQEHIWQLDAVIDELAALAAKEKGSARVSAVRVKLDAMKERIETLQGVGYLPHDLGSLGIRLEVQTMYKKMAAVLREEKVPDEVIMRIAEALRPVPVETAPPALPPA